MQDRENHTIGILNIYSLKRFFKIFTLKNGGQIPGKLYLRKFDPRALSFLPDGSRLCGTHLINRLHDMFSKLTYYLQIEKSY